MADFTPQIALAVLTENLTATQIADQTEREAYLKEVQARLGGRSADDRKEATKLAVETAKMLLTIAVAVLVATGALVQFARNSGVPWSSISMLAFALTLLALLVSMSLGLSAISKVYKRAEGTTNPGEVAWSTLTIKSNLNRQAASGLIALVLLVLGLAWAAYENKSESAAITVSIPSNAQPPPLNGPVTIEGNWTDLRIRTAGNQEIKLPASSLPIALMCK